VALIADPELRHPHSVAFSPNFNHLIVTNAGGRFVHVFAAQGDAENRSWSQWSGSSLEFCPPEAFEPANNESRGEGGAKGIAVHGGEIAICSPEMGVAIFTYVQ
jgi:hypothetical protein